MQIDVLLFDMGGVLVDWDGTTPLVALTGGRLDREAARRFWLESPWVGRHDLGQCDVETFADGALEELGLDMDRAGFIAEYLGWVRGLYPGCPELLEQLGRHYRLSTLTNNNAAHFERICRDLDLGRFFDQVFASHLLGMKKPDARIYAHVTEALGVPPERIAFFDDNAECLEPARAIGWQTFHTVGFESLRAALAGIGALDPDQAPATNR